MDAPVQKHRLIARKIIFIVPPCTPGSQNWGGTMSPPLTAAHEQEGHLACKKLSGEVVA